MQSQPYRFLVVLLAVGALGLGACRGSRVSSTDGACGTPACAPVTVADDCCEPCKMDCWKPSDCARWYLDASGSLLPNGGIGIGVGRVLKRTERMEYAVELLGTYQFTDDESFVDDGNPAAGDWYQVRVGLKTSSSPRARRHLTKRFGAVWLDAKGEPNILDEPGTYWGLYGGIGFETDLTSSLAIGPELAVMVVTPDDEFKVERPIPQLNWHVVWYPGGRGECLPRVPYGEVYAGVSATLSPGWGGGLMFGQVFSRSSLATWSFEMLGGPQETSTDLWFDGEGDWGQIRGGVKATFQPCGCGHWTARAGATWLRSTAPNEFLSETGDHYGAYLGAGYEWDIGQRFATGPELALLFVSPEKDFTVDVVPQLNWHFIFKF